MLFPFIPIELIIHWSSLNPVNFSTFFGKSRLLFELTRLMIK